MTPPFLFPEHRLKLHLTQMRNRMQERIKRHAEVARRTQGVNVQIRAGLNSCEFVVRAIGSDLHMDYAAIGRTTHLASLGPRPGELPELALQTVDIDRLGDELGGAVVAQRGRASRRDGFSSPYCAVAAAAPAMARWASWSLIAPEMPMAPIILPSATIGTPPSGVTPGAPSR